MTPARLCLAAESGRTVADQPLRESALAARGVTVAYNRKPVLIDASFTAPMGRRTAILGPNGAGKSTLLKATLGLIPRLSGDIYLSGEPVGAGRGALSAATAYVPQRASVDWEFPASVLDVALMGLHRQIGWMRWPGRRHRQAAMTQLDRVGMADFADRQIGQLSGGQQQRVFLARALAQDAPILVLDEPMAGVDAATEHAIAGLLATLAEEGRSVIAVHHDLARARAYFDHAVLLNGAVIAEGPVADALSRDALERAYGGRLAPTQLDAVVGAS